MMRQEQDDDNNPTKVLCVSGSPRGEKGSSDRLLVKLADHVREFGGEPEILRLAEVNMLHCEGCYSARRSDCTWPCIHHGIDQTTEVMEKIIRADALAIATSVFYGSVSSLVQKLVEKMLTVDNNSERIAKETGKEPFGGKPVVLLCSLEADGAALALSQLGWALNHMGFMILPWGYIFKHNILENPVLGAAVKLVSGMEISWIDQSIELAARNLVEIPKLWRRRSSGV